MDDNYQNEDYYNDDKSEKLSHTREVHSKSEHITAGNGEDEKKFSKHCSSSVIKCCVLTTEASFPECPGSWEKFQEKCYYYSREPERWNDARSLCQHLGADLIVIDNENEQASLS
ncbi:C-type lectin domain family 2 member B-like [Rhineura floridana]|uniref:C-type lectin domain family 2 member B-like n=1 Tax=Rhineura floridana TaxID=261503 RepID=UPI002AC86D5B|nr:C-type lectin domain family 2 member B-like [Rhineura floridana]